MLIIAGHLQLEADSRARYLAGCVAVVEAARAAPGMSAQILDAEVSKYRISAVEAP